MFYEYGFLIVNYKPQTEFNETYKFTITVGAKSVFFMASELQEELSLEEDDGFFTCVLSRSYRN